jgi:hypothetical protein
MPRRSATERRHGFSASPSPAVADAVALAWPWASSSVGVDDPPPPHAARMAVMASTRAAGSARVVIGAS